MISNANSIKSLIQRKFGHIWTSSNPSQVYVDCPYCVKQGLTPNTTHKLGIHLDKKKLHCFRCDIGGDLALFLPQIAVLPDAKPVEVIELSTSLEPLPTYCTLNALKYPWDKLVFKFLNDKHFPAATIANRVFFTEDYNKSNWSFGPRLLFPIYQRGEYRGFQARTIYKNTDPKYIGASNMDRRKILYNYDKAFAQNQLVITEGFFDCIRVGDCAVATLGKNITKDQIRLIRLGNFERVVVFLDTDAEKESYEIADKLKKHFPTFVAHPTKKDPGDMTKEEINNVFEKLERIY